MRAWLKKQNLGFWILSVVLAVVFWLYASIAQDYEFNQSYTVIPEFKGRETLLIERGIVVTNGTNVTVDVTLRGRRGDLDTCEGNIQVIARLNDITDAGVTHIDYDVILPDAVADKVQIIKRSTDTIAITTDRMESRYFDVKILRDGISVPNDYKLKRVVLDTPQVKVTGRLELLSKVAGVQIAPIRESLDRTSPFSATVILVDSAGDKIGEAELVCDPEEITGSLVVSKVRDVPLVFDYVEGGGARAANTSLEVYPPSIQLTGDPSVVDPLNSLNLGSINLADVADGETWSVLIILPNETESNAGPTAEVTIRFFGLATKRIYTEAITIVGGEREGYVVRQVEPGLSVTLRGPEADIAQLEVNNVRVVVDLTDEVLARGQQDVDVRVIVDGYPNVGAIASPKITVEMVAEAEEEP